MEKIKVIRSYEKEVKNIQLGDKIAIPLGELGEFTATANKITDKGVLFIFDEYVAKLPMNKAHTNRGGFKRSNLNRWLNITLYELFPEDLRQRIGDISIPSVGEIYGHGDEWNKDHFVLDEDEQLPLMVERKNRVRFFNNEFTFGWLRNTTKKSYMQSGAGMFAIIDGVGETGYESASRINGVCPEFWLIK